MDRRHTNQLLKLDRNAIFLTVAMFTGHCIVGRDAKILQFPSKNFFQSCGSAEQKKTVIHIIAIAYLSLSRRRSKFSTFGSLFLDGSLVGSALAYYM